ncbi:response regulator [Deinococcus peraridilitoris]|uniref:Response regulator with CheY-like receiver, AAA-type ATPase, and DNA-binding domains n=1 Tax=Deinococcus peraridilitoris (strain DSM 19664 / LMG 22246 / CIP 109416 / KR-200) TaxID=937777 RepID=K9ZYM0_DEIPD|nr:response regulator [Deinococcus peraridilitoris]AFZ65855.1 response regulator with CheY-like receiver, AAA-type ATPase, and DNA-binding domains [Deinococcus peraridilitoris DSM 19664]
MTQVLVVDDSLSVRKALETILRPLAYTVRMAESGEAALTSLAQTKADLVIADVLMPGMSGFELCQQIKASGDHAQTPVVLISGIVSEAELTHARGVGAVGIVKKPFRADELLPIVQGALRDTDTRGDVVSAPVAAPAQAPVVAELLDTLLTKQGILGAVLIDSSGIPVAWRGAELPDQATLARYLRFFVTSSEVFGAHFNDEWQSVLLEYAGRALLLSPLSNGHALAITLRDAGAATVAKFVIKGQRAQFDTALS